MSSDRDDATPKLEPLQWLRIPTTWVADRADLTDEQWGIQTKLMLISGRRGRLPADRAALARLAHTDLRALTRAWPSIAEYWIEQDGYVTCPYVKDEQERLAKSIKDGEKGAAIRKAKRVATR